MNYICLLRLIEKFVFSSTQLHSREELILSSAKFMTVPSLVVQDQLLFV